MSDQKTENNQNGAQENQRSVGLLLKASRERHGRSIQAVAESLCIRKPYIEAIEEGNYNDLPGHAYALGFVRAYAEHLGLDGSEVVRRFKSETSTTAKRVEITRLEPLSEASLPSLGMIFIAVLIAALVYGGWYMINAQDTVIEQVPDVPARMADDLGPEAKQPVEEQKPVEDATESKRATPKKTPAKQQPVENTSKQNNVSVVPIEKQPAEVSQPINNDKPKDNVTSEPQPEPDEPDEPEPENTRADTDIPAIPAPNALENEAAQANMQDGTPQDSETGDREARIYGVDNIGGRVVVRVTGGKSWVQVSARNDEGDQQAILLSKLLFPGDVYYIAERKDLFLDTGRLSNLRFEVDGKLLPVLRTKDDVLWGLPLQADRLQQKYNNLMSQAAPASSDSTVDGAQQNQNLQAGAFAANAADTEENR